VRGSVQAIPFGDCFDLVWCDGVLSYVPDPIVAIGELQRVTKPGGRLFFWVHTAVRSSPWLAIARGARRLPRFAREPVLDALALTRRAWRRVRRGSAKRSKQEGLHIRDWSIPPAIRPVPQTQLAAIARRNGWSIVRERIEPATSYYLLERSAEDGKTSNGDRAER
jgi:SAM-dependent methyltransferase